MSDKKKLFIKLGSAVLAVLILVFVCYDIFGGIADPYKTETALEETVLKTADMKLFVVRDEEYILGEFSAVTVPLIEDGERVKRGDAVAVACQSASDAEVLSEISVLEEEIERCEHLSSRVNLNILSVESLNREIDGLFDSFLSVAASGKLSDVGDAARAFRDKAVSRLIAVNGALDLTDKIDSLKVSLAELRAKSGSFDEITASSAGYYINEADGYEFSVSYDDVSDMTASDISEILLSTPKTVDTNVMGKLVGSFNWYLLGTLDSESAVELKEGASAKLIFPGSDIDTLTVKIVSVKTAQNSDAAVIFSCNQMSRDLASLRIEDAKLVLDEHVGYRISGSAVRTIDGVQGVFIRRGNIVSFRRADIVYSASDYVIVAPFDEKTNSERKSGTPSLLRLYDEVLVEGKELYDGKILS